MRDRNSGVLWVIVVVILCISLQGCALSHFDQLSGGKVIGKTDHFGQPNNSIEDDKQ